MTDTLQIIITFNAKNHEKFNNECKYLYILKLTIIYNLHINV